MNGFESITVFILAAGCSSRMGDFKPLLPFPEEPLIQRQVRVLRRAGVSDIRVVTGCREERLLPILDSLGIRSLHNPDYTEGMFSSVKTAAVDLLLHPAKGFSILPSDHPLLYPKLLADIFQAFDPKEDCVVFPCCKGKRGHPPVIPFPWITEILEYSGPGGLGGFLQNTGKSARDLETGCPGVLLDMDTREHYEKALKLYEKQQRPGLEECLEILERHKVPAERVRHSIKVSQGAFSLIYALNRRGFSLDPDLTRTAGLLHDISKGTPNHARTGAEIARYYGLDLAAPLIEKHMDYNYSKETKQGILTEGAVLFLADKYTESDTLVPLPLRRERSLQIYPEAEESIQRRFATAENIEAFIREITGLEPIILASRKTRTKDQDYAKQNNLSTQAL